MKSVADLMGKDCNRCGGGIYTSWRTLDNKKLYHPHCFTCVVCGAILDEITDPVEMSTLKEVYCHKCYKQCFDNDDEDDEENEEVAEKSVCSNHSSVYSRREYEYDCDDEDEGQPQDSHRRPLSSARSFNAQFQRRDEDPSISEGASDVSLLYSSQTYNTVHVRHKETVAGAAGGHANNLLPPPPRSRPSQRINTAGQNQLKDNLLRHPSEVNNNSMPKKFERPPEAFLQMRKAESNIRKLEPKKSSRIPRPSSASVSNRSLSTALTTAPPTSKSKVSNSVRANTSRSTTNNRSSSTINNGSSVSKSKLARSSSCVQPNPSIKSKTQDVTGPVVTKTKKSPTKKSSRARSQSAVETITKEMYAESGPIASISRVSVSRALVSRRQCAASFAKTEECVINESSDFQHRLVASGGHPVEQHQQCCFESHNQLDVQRHRQSMGVPTTQAILTAIGRGNSNLNNPIQSTVHGDNSESLENDKNTTVNYNNVNVRAQMGKLNFRVTFECPICISSLLSGNESALLKGGRPSGNGNVVTSCGHLFHRDCLENWLRIKGNKRCPICASLCLPETLQPVYLECNVSADLDSRPSNSMSVSNIQDGNIFKSRSYDTAFKALRSEFDLIKAKYNAILSEKNDYSLKVTIANSLQNAYDMECRNRLQLQWENKKLLRQIEALQRTVNEYRTD